MLRKIDIEAKVAKAVPVGAAAKNVEQETAVTEGNNQSMLQ